VKELTEQEIEKFMDILVRKLPVLEIALETERSLMVGFRNLPMTDTILESLEKSTERACRFYNIVQTWRNLVETGFPYDKRGHEPTCGYVRTVNNLFKNGDGFYA